LIGIRQRVNYEAQAAVELEMSIAPSSCGSGYPLQLVAEGDHWIISTRALFEALLEDLAHGTALGVISRRFHDGLVECFAGIATLIRDKIQINQVCLSGGTFHNAYLSRELETRLSTAGFQVFVQREVPAGDGGLSLGQALVAASGII
jgi:hydrogenase maturation protein HypF